jgi:hypothetical protein
VFIVDMGVYTRNRNFRLIYSTKMGKRLFLKPSAINRYVPPDHDAPRHATNTPTKQLSKLNIKKEKEEESAEGEKEEREDDIEGGTSYAWFLSSLVTRIGEGKETEMKKVYLLSCEPVPSEVRTYLTPNALARLTSLLCASTGRQGSALLLSLPHTRDLAGQPRHGHPSRTLCSIAHLLSAVDLRLPSASSPLSPLSGHSRVLA